MAFYPATSLPRCPRRYRDLLFFALLTTMSAGCATLPEGPLPRHDDVAGACRALFERSDAEIVAAGTTDGAAARIQGFPWLRVNRLLASFRWEVEGRQAFDAWVNHLAELDRDARQHELHNLDDNARQRLRSAWQPEAQHQRLALDPGEAMDTCQKTLNRALHDDADSQSRLREAAIAPDVYIGWQRAMGFYPIVSRFARPRVSALHERLGALFEQGPPHPDNATRYATPAQSPDNPSGEATSIASSMDRDALGIPMPTKEERNTLFNAYAPIWKVEHGGSGDEPGAIVLDAAARPVVDRDRPTEYRHLSWTRFADEVLLQLNYTLWFPERPGEGGFDLYAGHLDGVVWRVTLDSDGAVLAYDSMHTCGCYYTLLPGEGWQAAEPPAREEPIFAPASAPVPGPDERVLIGVESGTHYLSNVVLTEASEADQALEQVPMSALRSLPRTGDGSASIYDAYGLIPESRRAERFLFWPFGVPSAGASRQPGTHAIAFVGRRHFDEARLFERLLKPRTEETR